MVDTDEYTDGGRAESPGRDGTEEGELAGMQVVDDDRVKLWP